jgi:hypothetical protein
LEYSKLPTFDIEKMAERRSTKEIYQAVLGVHAVSSSNWASFREKPYQEYPKPASVYEELFKGV